jgi:hypothetical protein
MITPAQIQQIVSAHQSYWASQREELRECHRLYMTRFFARSAMDGLTRTEVPRAYKLVESYVGSLFSRQPNVSVKPDVRARGNPDVAQAVSNLFLARARSTLENAVRIALIYPAAYLKLAPAESTDPLERITASACPPWEVLVDDTAPTWGEQRWVGHIYQVTVAEAAARYGVAEAELRGRPYQRVDAPRGGPTPQTLADWYTSGQGTTQPADTEMWIQVAEIYDLRADRLLIWSPEYQSGTEFLFKGVKIETGTLGEEPEEVKETGIPYRTASGRPVVPIIPIQFGADPDVPLRGYSLLARSKDQFRELNLLRSYQAQGVRRMARQWMTRAGFLSPEAAAKLAQGLDGEIIEVDAPPGTDLAPQIVPVPQTPIPADMTVYAQTVLADIQDAGLLAPFTSGEATRTTATEANLLASYTSTEIGRMARTRDEAVAAMAQTYCVMLSLVLGDSAEPLALPYPSGPTMLSAEDLTGDMSYYAEDAGATPISDASKRANLVQLAPLLVQLGADPERLRMELVRAFQLPEDLAEAAQPPAPEAPVPPPEVP